MSQATFRKHRVDVPPDFFIVEAEGLDWLRVPGGVAVPKVLAVTSTSIELERLEPGPWTRQAEERFGRELAELHRAGAEVFGHHRDGYIGDLALDNTPASTWPLFWAERRVLPLARDAHGRGLLASAEPFERVCARLDEIAGPAEPPARLHGDLWRGNVLADRAGRPWIIDPAVHGGHRETDLAMLRLFGGFSERVFGAYAEVWPLAEGWRDRVALHQLHPLLVHTLLFGGGYGAQAAAAARRYC